MIAKSQKDLSADNNNPEQVDNNSNLAQSYYQQARQKVQQDQLQEAIPYYKQTLKHDPKHVIAYQELGNILLKLKRPKEAINCYNQALHIQSNLSPAYHSLGDAFSELEQWKEAILNYQKAIQLNPDFFWSYNNLADIFLQLEQWEQAAQTYQTAIQLNPDFSWSHHNLGKACLMLKRWQEAVTACQKAVELNPDSCWSYYNLAEALLHLQKWDEAIQAYCQALQLKSDLPQAEERLNYARHQSVKSKLELAKYHYQKAIEQDPDNIDLYYKALGLEPMNPELYMGLGIALRMQGEFREAITAYEKAISFEPNNLSIYLQLAEVLTLTGEEEKALDNRFKAFTLEPTQFSLKQHYDLGDQLQEIGQLERAKICYQRLLKLNPNFIQAYGQLGKVFAQQQQWEQAIDWYKQGIEHDSQQAECYQGLGEAWAKQRAWEKAISVYQKAIELQPEHGETYHHYGDAFLNLKQWSEAVKCYQKSIQLNPDYIWSYWNLGLAYFQLENWEELCKCYQEINRIDSSFLETDIIYHNHVSEELRKIIETYKRGEDPLSNSCKNTNNKSTNTTDINIDKNLKLNSENKILFSDNLKVMDLLTARSSREKKVQMEETEIYLEQGNAFQKEEQFEEALKYYKKAVKLEPENWLGHHQLGDTFLKLEQYEESIHAYHRCLELNPNSVWSYYNLGLLFCSLSQFEEAFNLHQKLTEIEPDFWKVNQLNFKIQHKIGDFWFGQGYFENASIAYKRSIQLKPNFHWSHHNLGRSLYNLGQIEEAIASIRKAVEFDSNFDWGYYYLGEMLSELGDLDQAIHYYQKALDKNPENPDFHYRLGMTLISQERWEEASSCYQKVIEIQPDHWQAQNILKDALASHKQLITETEKIEAKFNKRKSFKTNQNKKGQSPYVEIKREASTEVLSCWEEHFNLGNKLQLQGKLEEAKMAYYQAIVQNSLYSLSYHNLGDTCLKLGHWQEAIDTYHQAIKLNPEYFWSNYNLGVAFSNSGKWGEAINLYRRSVHLNPGFNLPLLALREALMKRWDAMMSEGDTLLRQGNRGAANLIYQTAIKQYKESLYLPEIDLPKEIPTHPSILLIVDDCLTQCLRYRVKQKVEQLEAAGFSVEYIPQRDVVKAKNVMHFYHVVIFYRVPAFPEIIEMIQYAKAIKKVVFYEIDDLIFDSKEYPDSLESYGNQITQGEYQGLVRGVILFREAMALVDDGIASTPALAQEMEKVVNRQVFLHRNALDHHNSDFIKLEIPKVQRDYLTIFYGTGTKAHNSDFNELVAPAIAKILEKYPHVRFTLIGYLTLPKILEPYQSQIDQVGILKDLNVYWEFLKQADINIAVLHKTKANNCKSELKWFEAAVLGVPSVVSGTQTYQEVIEHERDGLIANTPKEWYQQLERLVKDERLRTSIAKTAAEKVNTQYSVSMMADNIKKIIKAGIAKAIEQGDLVPRSAKKKLLIVNVFYPPQSIGGATRIVRDNVDVLKEKYSDQYEISVFTSDDDNPSPYQISEYVYQGVHVTKVSTPMMAGMDWQYQNPELYKIFSQYLKFNQPDLIHFHCIQRLTASILEAAADLKIPYLVTIHDAWWISDHQFLVNPEGVECNYQQNDPLVVIQDAEDVTTSMQRRQYLRQQLEQASAVLAVSETFTELYRRNGILKTQSNCNGIMPRPQFPRQPSASGKVRLAHIGGMAAHKGYFLFKEAIESNSFSNLEVIVVNHAQAAGTTSQDQWGNTPVTYIAKISQEKMPQFYSTIDILVAPSMWPESYGLVAREAVAAGVWVVASNKGALAEDLIPGVTGYRFNPDKIEELVKILRKIDQESEKYQQLVEAEVHVRTTEEQVRELNEIYNTVF